MIDFAPMLKAIDDAIAKAKADLESFLETAGYKNPSELAETIEAAQNSLEDVLFAYKQRIETALSKIEDPLVLLQKWDETMENEALKLTASNAVAEVFFSRLRNHLDQYIKDDDPELSASTVTKKTVARIIELSDVVANSKVDGVNRCISYQIERLIHPDTKVEKAESDDDEDDEDATTDDDVDDDSHTAEKALIAAILASAALDRMMDCRGTSTTAGVSYQSYLQQEAIWQNPSVTYKQWNHCKDPSVMPRPHHLALDGVTADADGYFTLIGADGGTYYVEFPRDPVLPVGEIVNCHCTVTSVVDKDLLAAELDERLRQQQAAIALLDEQYEKEASQEMLDRVMLWIEAYIAMSIAEELIEDE